jgi:4-alpha-glucanotransferase
MGGDGAEDGCRRYSALYKTPDAPGLVWYYFIVSTNSITRYYGNNEGSLGGVGLTTFSPPASYQITVYEESPVPEWWKEGMVYQIFVDRFSRGKDWKERFFNAAARERKAGPTRLMQTDWRDAPFLYKDDRGWVTRWPFFGGTLEGVREKLNYLRSLGVTIIYFNPIFEAASNHKYDTADYMKIDPGYGDEGGFKRLIQEAEEYGISIMLDGVFSHTGADSKYFNKYGNYPEIGAWQSQDSPYRSWYRFNHDAEGYECWWGVADLPNVEESDPSYQEYIWGGKDSVIRHWLKAGVMGWRLDVADELPDEFIRNIKTALKETEPEGVLLGEVWEDASNKRSYGMMREYFLGKELDSTMNYPFKAWCMDFALNRVSPADVHARVMNLFENYPREHFYACLNLIGSHDSVRALTALCNPPDEAGMSEWQKQSWRMDGDRRDIAKRRLRLLSLWQMTFPGVPSIYYGDEAGMEGFSDPHNRGTYPWGSEDEELLGWYRIICNLRAEYEIFRNGEFISYGGYANTYAFCRFNANERAIVFLNASSEQYEDVSLRLFSSEILCLELLSGTVLEPEYAAEAVLEFESAQAGKPWASSEGLSMQAGTPDAFWRGVLKRRQRLYGQGKDEDARAGKARMVNLSIEPGGSRVIYIKNTRPEALVMKNARRAAGILCHITSLPSVYGCGDFGSEAYTFCDYLAAAGQRIWQILPLNPTGAAYSPYSSCSAFAGNELLLDLNAFVNEGLLSPEDLPQVEAGSKQADFERALRIKLPLYRKAYAAFNKDDKKFREFCVSAASWLDDYCLYRAISAHFGDASWQDWPKNIRERKSDAMKEYKWRYADEMGFYRFLQYKFAEQWQALKTYANAKNISILGDMPIYVAAHSCDTWVNRDVFLLDDEGRPYKTGGVPPDFFSDDGQNWKNPVFDWKSNKAHGYAWWIERFKRNLQLYDFLRLDHFRGFEACWEIPGEDSTAKNGQWIKGPGKDLFDAVEAALGSLPFLAEDLGYITSNVNDLKNTFAWPGLKVYQFHADEMDLGDVNASGSESAAKSEKTPAYGDYMQVYYTGTHDNNTLAAWVAEQMAADGYYSSVSDSVKYGRGHSGVSDSNSSAHGRRDADAADGVSGEIKTRCKTIIESLYASKAMWVIIPLQDIWFLGGESRMNTPGTVEGNWLWTAHKDAFTSESQISLKRLTEAYAR